MTCAGEGVATLGGALLTRAHFALLLLLAAHARAPATAAHRRCMLPAVTRCLRLALHALHPGPQRLPPLLPSRLLVPSAARNCSRRALAAVAVMDSVPPTGAASPAKKPRARKTAVDEAAAPGADAEPAARGAKGKKKAAASSQEAADGAAEGGASAGGVAKKAKAAPAEKEVVPRTPTPRAPPPAGGAATFKVLSWNVAGLRALLNDGKKGKVLQDLVAQESPDAVCLQAREALFARAALATAHSQPAPAQEHKLQVSHVADVEARPARASRAPSCAALLGAAVCQLTTCAGVAAQAAGSCIWVVLLGCFYGEARLLRRATACLDDVAELSGTTGRPC